MKRKSLLLFAIPAIAFLFVIIFPGCEKDEDVKPAAAFTASETNVVVGETVNFTDESTNAPTSWEWDFGDGEISNEQNPTHAYQSEGTYTISLTVSNEQGSDTETKTDYITATNDDNQGDDNDDDDDNNNDDQDGEFTDARDGTTYNTVTLGGEVWMAENLKYAGNVNGNSWCYNDDPSKCETYGRLYDWEAAMEGSSGSSSNPSGVQGICPDGWHIPSDDEWKALEGAVDATYDYSDDAEWDVEGYRGDNAGSALAGNNSLWNDGDLNGNADFGTSGFNGLPGGRRTSNGDYTGVNEYGYWWSASESDLFTDNAFFRSLYYQEIGVNRTSYNKNSGLSVRCVKD